MQFGLDALRLRGAEPLEVVDAIGACADVDLLDAGDFLFAGGDDQFAEPGMRNAVPLAIGVEPLAPFDTAARLQTPLRIVEPTMNDLAVARGSLKSDRVSALEDDDLVPGERQRARRGEADDPGADDDRFDFVHPNARASCSLRPGRPRRGCR
jgi:hypothetical protein